MGYKAYPQTTQSNSKSLGFLPSNWKVKRGRFVMQVNPAAPTLRHLRPEDEVSFIPMEAVGEFGELNLEQKRVLAEVSGGYTEFQNGDVIVAKITPCFENGKAALAEGLLNGAAYGTTELHVLRAGPMLERRFLFYTAISDTFRKLGESEMYGAGGQKRVPPEFSKDYLLPLPSLQEQQQIAAFLDWKTGQIDALITRKKELLEKLKEKRLAVITQAVTRGLNPDAPLRNSGIPWLGQVPAHWEVKRLKFMADIRYGLGEPPEYVEEGLNLVRATDVSKGTIAKDGFKKVRQEDVPWERKPGLRAGEIIVVRSGAYAGDSAIVPTELEGSIAGFDMVLTATGIHPAILAWALLSPYLLEAQIYQTRLRAAQPHLNAEELGNFAVVVPAPTEQEAIATHINRNVGRIECMMERTQAAITRLTEYRIALITAATTGKIDVRNVQIPEPAQP
jgi:type I restriction enzyme S subunit